MRDRLVDAVRLGAATLAVLGTASLLFVLTFRERPFEPSSHAREIADHLLDLAVSGDGRLAAVGHSGRILRSADGGRSWTFPPSGVDTPLAGVAFRDERTGLAVGYGGVILKSVDGGGTWSRAASGVDVYLTSVRFAADGRALAMGEWGTVLESADGGGSWRTITTGEHDFIINDFDVLPGGRGWAVGELGRALVTSDGGRTWSPRFVVPDETTLFTVDLVGDDEIWIGGSDSLLLHSRDGGSTWERQTAPCSPTQILRVRFAGSRGYAVGRRCVTVTSDGGRSWHASALAESVRYSWLYGLSVAGDEAWAAGYGEGIFHAGADDSWSRVKVARERGPADG